MRRYPRVGFSAARRSASRQSSADVDGRPGGRCGWVQCPTMRRRCQRNSVSGVTSHPVRLGRASAAAIAPSKLRSASVSSGRSICRRSTASWWRNTMISRSFQRPDRTVSRASDANNRYKIRYTRTQHRPASRQVNDHGRVSGTHRVRAPAAAPITPSSCRGASASRSGPPQPRWGFSPLRTGCSAGEATAEPETRRASQPCSTVLGVPVCPDQGIMRRRLQQDETPASRSAPNQRTCANHTIYGGGLALIGNVPNQTLGHHR